MAAEGPILAAAGGRLECPLVLHLYKATGAVRLFRIDAVIGAVLLLRLDAARGAAFSPLFVDAVTGSLLILPGGGASTNGPLADGFRLDCAAVAKFRLDAATDAAVTLRLAADTGAVLLLRIDAAIGAVIQLRPDAATGAVPSLHPDVATGIVPPLHPDVAIGSVPRLGFAAAPDPERPLGLAAATDVGPLYRLAAAADVAPRLLFTVAADGALLFRLVAPDGSVPPLRPDAATGAVPPLGLATASEPISAAAEAAPLIREAEAADAASLLREAAAADAASLLRLAVAADAALMLRLAAPADAARMLRLAAVGKKAGKRVRKRVSIGKRLGKTASQSEREKKAKSDKASRGSKKLLQFKAILGDFVWFAIPSVLLFYPRKVETETDPSNLQVSLTWLEFSTNGLEKKITMTVFVVFVSIWFLAYLLASVGRGARCTTLVGNLTLATVLSVIAFVDFGLYKSTASNAVLFGVHFIVMVAFITKIWMTFVYATNQEFGLFRRIKGWRFRRNQAAGLSEPLLGLSEPLLGTNSSEPLLGADLC